MTSGKPSTRPTVSGSPSTTTPRPRATAGLTKVNSIARGGPTSPSRAKNTTKASAVQIRARPSSAPIAGGDGSDPGALRTAGTTYTAATADRATAITPTLGTPSRRRTTRKGATA